MKEILIILMAFKGEIDAKYLQKELESFYHVRTKVVVEKEINSIAYDKKYHRYSAAEILDYQLNYYDDRFTVGITSKDIAIRKRPNSGGVDWGVLGLSFVGKEVAVMSLYRTKHNKQRAVKVLLHEVGHGMGLPHCTSGKPCMMRSAEGKGSNMDRQPKALCIICQTKLNKLQR